VLPILVQARLVTEVAGPEPGFVPARPLEDINVYDILQALRTANGKELPADEAGELETIYGEFARVERAEREAASGITLLSLVERISGDLRGAAPALLKAPEPATEKMIVAETLAAVSPVVEVSTEEAERPRPPGPVQPSEHDFPL